ncbi:DEAD/DEAH box helicase [Rhodohalobacter halophilus]|uniref:DEAD/DEAH box helicase n=1 Tax=Rhodohalobacter halophilus TaxID=1812810 RepID=UPI00083F57EE|nr:AAA domain-containing protein [Rhodohalobacter halophilus]
MDIKKLLDQAITALESEIETVRERPSSDVLFEGKRDKITASENVNYKFESHQPAIRFAEEIKAMAGEKSWTVHPVSYEDKEVTLQFPEDVGISISELHVEWENDFILKRTLSEIVKLDGRKKGELDRLEHLFEPNGQAIPGPDEVDHDGLRNEAQEDAIRMSMNRRATFIWGPPGTGKTATLGYIIANYLKNGKKVLFASNTNRAVDVGLLSALDALQKIGLTIPQQRITRFGEAALDASELDPILFSNQLEQTIQKRQEEAGEWIGLMERRKQALQSVEKRLRNGKQPTNNQELEMKLIDQKVKDAGGLEELEAKLEELSQVNDRAELWKKQLVATTLAKVCTSDLFHDLEFDAVVVDECSMANLPYMMVLAAHAKWHMVVVGDPMQLPPIALTSDRKSREFLEKDIFTTVSGADSSEALFRWHDEHPDFTAFFDTQYRLEESLADVISTVFYEGRLKTGKIQDQSLGELSDRAFHLVNTSKYGPFLEQKSGERGFKPINMVHQEVVERLLKNMGGRGIFMEDIGVIVPFRSAVYDLRNRLYEAGIRNVEVGTIHTFQGREKDYIIFDTVMSGEKQRGTKRHYSVRPLDEEKNGLSVPRLLNVAFSRSRKELVVIADMEHVERVYGGKFLGKLLKKIGG